MAKRNKISLEEMKEKIGFSSLSFTAFVFFGVALCIWDQIGDVYLAAQLYCCSNVTLYCSTISIVMHCDNNEGDFSSYFSIYVVYMILVALYILFKSFITYWREERAELTYWESIRDPKSWWTVTRTAFHLFSVAPAARTIELALLGFQSEHIFNEALREGATEEAKAEARRHFEKIKSRHKELAFLQHRENSFESGPQLWFKMHLLSLHLLSGKNLGSYNFWSLIFIAAGIVSCSWRVVSNRRSVNLSDDFEKRMRWTNHILVRLIAHILSVCARFSLLGMFSASFPIMGIAIFCAVHFVLIGIILIPFIVKVLIVKVVSFIVKVGDGRPINNVSENRGSCCSKAADLFVHVCDVYLSSLFSFPDFDVKKSKKWPIIYHVVYNYVPAFENVILIVFACYSGRTLIHFVIAAVICLLLSWPLLYICENVRPFKIPSSSSPSQANPNPIPIRSQYNPTRLNRLIK